MRKCAPNISFVVLLVLCLLCVGCNTTKFVPEGKYLLNKTKIVIDDAGKGSASKVMPSELRSYLRQTPNTEVFGFWKLQLHIYNTAPADTSTLSKKRLARNAHRVGEAPEVFSEEKAAQSMAQVKKAVQNKGYFNAEVDTTMAFRNRKLNLTYRVHCGDAWTLHQCTYQFPEQNLSRIATDHRHSEIREGMIFDVSKLNAERQRIARAMRSSGCYYFDKDMLRYTADSTLGNRQVDVEMSLRDYVDDLPDSLYRRVFRKYLIRRVYFHTDYDPEYLPDSLILGESTRGDYHFTWAGRKQLLREKALIRVSEIRPGEWYSEKAVEDTYEHLNRLGIIKYVDISFDDQGDNQLDCHIVISRTKLNSVAADIEGNYSNGDWGVAAGLGYVNKNIFRGAEELSVSARGGYEWRQNGGRAIEAKANAGLKFPNSLKIQLEYNYQKRPDEFTRTIASAGLGYTIGNQQSRWKHAFSFLDISYVYLPWISDDFRTTFLRPNNLLKFSYEDHFIEAFAYGVGYSSFDKKVPYRSYGTLKMRAELAGNFLYGLSHLCHFKKNDEGAYTVFNIPYSQYAKMDFEFTYHGIFTEKHRLVMRGAIGVAVPFGNAQTIPFEKRYFAGGSNSLRGWTMRSLGPGAYKGTGDRIDYNNQAGDIRLDLNLEYRWKVWTIIELAAFTDAGNVWTIHEYNIQPHGDFRWNRFYKEIAWSYGAGLRLDLSFLILRLDFGFKLYDPSRIYTDGKQWRTATNSWRWKEDAAIHFAIGYPF